MWMHNSKDFSRKRKRNVRLFVLDYKRVKQSRRRVLKIQSTLCEVAYEKHSRSLKIAVVKVYRTVINAYENINVKKYSEQINFCIIKLKRWHIKVRAMKSLIEA